MRYAEFKLFETAGQYSYYSVGDSHSNGVSNYGRRPGWKALGVDGSPSKKSLHLKAIDSIPKGSSVVISLGANDATIYPNEPVASIASRVAGIVNHAKSRGLNVVYLLPTLPAANKPKDPRREQLRDALKAAISVPTIDLGQASTTDSMGLHLDPAGYSNIANQIKSSMTPSKVTPDQGGYPGDKNNPPGVERLTSIDVPKYRREPAVADIQKVLLALGYKLPEHGVDGIRGKETMSAIREFQKDYGLKIDGVPGEETVGKLNELLKSKPNVFKNVTKSTAADVKKYAFEPTGDEEPTDADKVKPIDTKADTAEARSVAEQYVGRKLTDEDWSWLLRTLTGESASNPKSYAWCAAVILNRTHNPGKFRASGSSIRDIVMAPFQFEAVTGRKGRGYNPNSGVANGPNKRQTSMIVDGLINELPKVPKNYIGFTSTNLKIYGSDKGRQFALTKINHPSAVQIAGTVFTTV